MGAIQEGDMAAVPAVGSMQSRVWVGHEGRLGFAGDREHDQDLWADTGMADSTVFWERLAMARKLPWA